MSRYKLLNLISLILVFLLAACQRRGAAVDEAADILVDLQVVPDPPAMGEALLELSLEDEQGAPIEGAELEVKGDMTHAGMVPVLADFEEVGEGRYQAEFEWTMGGDWILTITGVLPDGRELMRTLEFTVRSGMH
jgi:hypothetical protein